MTNGVFSTESIPDNDAIEHDTVCSMKAPSTSSLCSLQLQQATLTMI
jgi:hypothetical protein